MVLTRRGKAGNPQPTEGIHLLPPAGYAVEIHHDRGLVQKQIFQACEVAFRELQELAHLRGWSRDPLATEVVQQDEGAPRGSLALQPVEERINRSLVGQVFRHASLSWHGTSLKDAEPATPRRRPIMASFPVFATTSCGKGSRRALYVVFALRSRGSHDGIKGRLLLKSLDLSDSPCGSWLETERFWVMLWNREYGSLWRGPVSRSSARSRTATRSRLYRRRPRDHRANARPAHRARQP